MSEHCQAAEIEATLQNLGSLPEGVYTIGAPLRISANSSVIGSIEPLPRFRLKPTGIGRARFIQQAFRVTEGSTVKYVWRAIEQVEDDAPDEVSSI